MSTEQLRPITPDSDLDQKEQKGKIYYFEECIEALKMLYYSLNTLEYQVEVEKNATIKKHYQSILDLRREDTMIDVQTIVNQLTLLHASFGRDMKTVSTADLIAEVKAIEGSNRK